MIWGFFWRGTLAGLGAGAGLGALYGTLLFPIIGTIYGGCIGGIVGLPLGALASLLLALVTALFFRPLTNPQRYRTTTRPFFALITGLATPLGIMIILGRETWPSFAIIPGIIAAAAGFKVSGRLIHWYERAAQSQDPGIVVSWKREP